MRILWLSFIVNALENRCYPIFKQGGAGASVPLGSKEVSPLLNRVNYKTCGSGFLWKKERAKGWSGTGSDWATFDYGKMARDAAKERDRIQEKAAAAPGDRPCLARG